MMKVLIIVAVVVVLLLIILVAFFMSGPAQEELYIVKRNAGKIGAGLSASRVIANTLGGRIATLDEVAREVAGGQVINNLSDIYAMARDNSRTWTLSTKDGSIVFPGGNNVNATSVAVYGVKPTKSAFESAYSTDFYIQQYSPAKWSKWD